MTDEQVSGMCIGLLLAGQHTSSTTGSWLGFYICADPTLQYVCWWMGDQAVWVVCWRIFSFLLDMGGLQEVLIYMCHHGRGGFKKKQALNGIQTSTLQGAHP